MYTGGDGAAMHDQEYKQLHSFMVDGGDRFGVSCLCFDTQELLWMGNQGVGDCVIHSFFLGVGVGVSGGKWYSEFLLEFPCNIGFVWVCSLASHFSGYGVGLLTGRPWFESRQDHIFLPCIYSFLSLLRTLFIRWGLVRD